MAKRIVTKIGDIFCVEVDNAYKRYFQYFCNDLTQLNSSVIRVFKKRYPVDYKPKPEDIVKDEVDFYAHTILRNGIEDGLWYKVGKATGDFEEEKKTPVFATCQNTMYINGEICDVDPDFNWYIWKVNQPFIPVGKLPEEYRDVAEEESVNPEIESFNRIKYGYYRWTSDVFNLLRRHPHPDIDSYVKRETVDRTLYLHFKGEDVVQKIEEDNNGEFSAEEGSPLPLPKFWETNWKHAEFITAYHFNNEMSIQQVKLEIEKEYRHWLKKDYDDEYKEFIKNWRVNLYRRMEDRDAFMKQVEKNLALKKISRLKQIHIHDDVEPRNTLLHKFNQLLRPNK